MKTVLSLQKIFFLSAYLFLISHPVEAQPLMMPDSGRYIIYKWLRPIGSETYKITRTQGSLDVSMDYYYEDRGAKVPLKARAVFMNKFSPQSLVIKGKTGQFSSIADSIVIIGGKTFINRRDTSYAMQQNKNSFLLPDDIPVTMLAFLVKFWEANGRPGNVHTLPDNYDVEIRSMGYDTLMIDDKTYRFQRYRIDRGKWVVKYFWTDTNGEFGATTSRFEELVNEKYAGLLNQFRIKTAHYELSDFLAIKQISAPLAITNANLIDVRTGEQKPLSTVVIKDGIIEWIGPANKASIPKGTKLIDGGGLTLLPGLWDMHVHYGIAGLGPAFLGMGITTVRDCANEFEFIDIIKKAIDESRTIGPTILRAGIVDGSGPNTLSIITADSEEEAIKRVRHYKQAGYDQIKIYSSVKPQIVKVICAEAHKLGLTVTGHIPTGMKLSGAIDDGMNGFSHIHQVFNGFEVDTSTMTIDFRKEGNKLLLQKLKSNQIMIDATLCIYELTRRSLNTPIKDLYPSYTTWPKFLQAKINDFNISEDTIRKYKMPQRFEGYKKLILKFFQEGLPVVAGTDFGLLPGYTLYRELELYVSAGLTPLQAIQTATLIPAKAMNRLSQSGTIEVGKAADLILIGGNPLKRITDIKNVKWVFKGAQFYNAEELRNKVGLQ